jgi:hypothetical protein
MRTSAGNPYAPDGARSIDHLRLGCGQAQTTLSSSDESRAGSLSMSL